MKFETESAILRALRVIVSRPPMKADESLCAYCGFRPHVDIRLCHQCAGLLARLALKHPEEHPAPPPVTREPEPMRKLSTAAPEWLPHNSE